MTCQRERNYVSVRGASRAYEVADVLREYGDTYRAQYAVTPEQARVMASLVACRTRVLGGKIYECLACGAVEFAYCSCRDRHCPKCQKFARAQWVEQQKVYLLPIPYFHVVFTTDHALNAWVPANRAVIYNLLPYLRTARTSCSESPPRHRVGCHAFKPPGHCVPSDLVKPPGSA